jgi:hypothetical protein
MVDVPLAFHEAKKGWASLPWGACVTTLNLAGGARFGVRQLAAAFRTASLLAVCTWAVAKRVRREQARCMKAAASRRTPKRLRRRQARQATYHTDSWEEGGPHRRFLQSVS